MLGELIFPVSMIVYKIFEPLRHCDSICLFHFIIVIIDISRLECLSDQQFIVLSQW